MIKKLRKNQEGSVAMLVGVMLPVLIGFLGLALDVGNLVVVRTQMQNAVDAAVCAGCVKLSLPIPTGQARQPLRPMLSSPLITSPRPTLR